MSKTVTITIPSDMISTIQWCLQARERDAWKDYDAAKKRHPETLEHYRKSANTCRTDVKRFTNAAVRFGKPTDHGEQCGRCNRVLPVDEDLTYDYYYEATVCQTCAEERSTRNEGN